MRILVLGIGNDLLADDAVGILSARRLKERQQAGAIEALQGLRIVESALSGVALLDLFIGHEKAIVIDAIRTGGRPPGTIIELSPSDLGAVTAPSPHFTGIPELSALARELGLEFPAEVKIFAMEAKDLETIGGSLSPQVEKALEDLVLRVEAQILQWQKAGG